MYNNNILGVSKPRASKSSGRALASPRTISKTLFDGAAQKPHRFCTLAIAQWAQFVFADLAQVGSTMLFQGGERLPLPCCAAEHEECMPIITDKDDEPYKGRENIDVCYWPQISPRSMSSV